MCVPCALPVALRTPRVSYKAGYDLVGFEAWDRDPAYRGALGRSFGGWAAQPTQYERAAGTLSTNARASSSVDARHATLGLGSRFRHCCRTRDTTPKCGPIPLSCGWRIHPAELDPVLDHHLCTPPQNAQPSIWHCKWPSSCRRRRCFARLFLSPSPVFSRSLTSPTPPPSTRSVTTLMQNSGVPCCSQAQATAAASISFTLASV